MSIFSGKCDLADMIFMQKHRTKDGSDKKEDLDKEGVLYSDEMECFDIFKKKTNGVIYTRKKVVVSDKNIRLISELNNQLSYSEKTIVDDNGKKKKVKKFVYYGMEFSSYKKLNNFGVHVELPIHFETLLDIIPYYPHIVISACSCTDYIKCVISPESYVDERYYESLNYGSGMYLLYGYYKKALQNHYREVVLNYFNPEGREVSETVQFSADKPHNAKLQYGIDENFDIKWIKGTTNDAPHFHYPIIVDVENGIIRMDDSDYSMLGNTMTVKYVKRDPSRELHIG